MGMLNLQYVLRDKTCVGFLLDTAKGWKAFDVGGLPIGLFDSEELAAPVYEQATDNSFFILNRCFP
jgi:hypothetical protein